MKRIVLTILMSICQFLSAQLYISEILVSPPGTNSPNEFIELRGSPGATIPNNTYLIQIEGDGSTDPGDIEPPASGGVIDLSGKVLGINGYLVILTVGHPYTVDPNATILTGVTDGSLEGPSHTFLLVNSPTKPTTDDDIDNDNDGVPDGTLYNSWTILDGISILNNDNLSGNGEFAYANLVFCKCNVSDANVYTLPGATVVYTGTKQFDYFARVGESTGNSLTSNPSTTDWFGGDLLTARTTDTNNYKISAFNGKAYPQNYAGLEINTLGKANAIIGNDWLGTDSIAPNEWSKTTNWSLGTIPVATDYVFIKNGLSNYPTVSIPITIKSVFMEAGSSIIAKNTFSGNIMYSRSINRFSDKFKGWYFMSSPVVGQAYNDFFITINDIAVSGTNRAISNYNTGLKKWTYHQGGGNAIFNSGVGYAIKKGQNTGAITFSGTLNTANSGVNVPLTATGEGYNLIGNPYPSYLIGTTLLGNSSISETKSIWVYNHTMGTNGAYQVKNLSTDFMIAPGQGFFVKVNSAGGTFNFSEANQHHNTRDTFQKTSKPALKITITDGMLENNASIQYLNTASIGFDVGYEGKLFDGVKQNFAVYSALIDGRQDEKYQIQSLPNANFNDMVIPIGLISEGNKEITFTIEKENFTSDLKVYLEDNEKNTLTRLDLLNSDYKVTLLHAISGIGRFYLHTKNSILSSKKFELNSIKVVKTSKNTLKIGGLNQQKGAYYLYNILGKKIVQASFRNTNSFEIHFPNIKGGIYILQLKLEDGIISKKVVFN